MKCTKCGEPKTADEMIRSRRAPSGFGTWCKACNRENERQRRKREPDIVRAKDRQRHHENKNDAEYHRRRKEAGERRTPFARKIEWYKATLPLVDPEYVLLLITDPCAYCGGPGGEIDHIIPKTRGGDDTSENLVGCCRKCNPSKSNQDLLSWMLRKAS